MTVKKSSYRAKKRMNLSWYVKLNILVLSFLAIIFLMKQVNTNNFQSNLNSLFTPAKPVPSYPVRLSPSSK